MSILYFKNASFDKINRILTVNSTDTNHNSLTDVEVSFSEDRRTMFVSGNLRRFSHTGFGSGANILRLKEGDFTEDEMPLETEWKVYEPNRFMRLFGVKSYRYVQGYYELKQTTPIEFEATNWMMVWH